MTHGTLTYMPAERKWMIQCAPHVAIKLKRVFGKIGAADHKYFLISDTLDNCRDLVWFMQRYPLEIKSGLVRLHRGAQDHCDQTALVERLLARQIPAQAFELAIPAREYQKVAAAVYLAKGGLLLADDVGTGKTITAICSFGDPRTRPALVVAPIQVLKQWKEQINRFAPHLAVHIVKKGQPYDVTDRSRGRKQMAFPAHFPDVVIMNYHKLAGWAGHIAPLVKSVVYDECQELRRRGNDTGPSAKYHAALHVSREVQFRLGMSATPIYNYGDEIFNVLECIFPEALGTQSEFKNEWCSGPIIHNPVAFGEYMRESGMMVRRTRAEVGRELPELTKVPHHIDADLGELDKVAGSAVELAQTILKQNEGFRGEKMQASEILLRLLNEAGFDVVLRVEGS